MTTIKNALISVSDKHGLENLISPLQEHGIQIYASGGTKAFIQENAGEVRSVEELTGNPEAFSGRMKTLSFKIGSGILFRRNEAEDLEDLKRLAIAPIDLVICNLYPFEETYERLKSEGRISESLGELVEKIDIGGPTMIRAAAKNHAFVSVLVDPADYPEFIARLKEGRVDAGYRKKLALKAFDYTARVECLISKALHVSILNEEREYQVFTHARPLKYGENPHQKASFFQGSDCQIKQVAGPDLGFNNLLDLDAALRSLRGFGERVSVSVVKHNNPCGLASGNALKEVIEAAWAGDSMSAFGSVVAINQKLDLSCAQFFKQKFIEVLCATDFSDEALIWFSENKPRVRLVKKRSTEKSQKDFRSLLNGVLVQERDDSLAKEIHCVTKLKFPEGLLSLARFSEVCGKALKSNAIAICRKNSTGVLQMLGAGQGQPNRVEALSSLAVPRALRSLREMGESEDLKECVLYSDAFFPFADSIVEAHRAGIRFIVQPGGSKRDDEVIKACDELGVSMGFTGMRHFNH